MLEWLGFLVVVVVINLVDCCMVIVLVFGIIVGIVCLGIW